MQADLCQPTSLKLPAHLSTVSCTPLGATANGPLRFCQPSARSLPADLSKCCQRTSRVPANPFPRRFLPMNLSKFVPPVPRNARQSQILHDFWCCCSQDCQRTSLVRAVFGSGFPNFSAKARGWLENMGSGFEIHRCIPFIIRAFADSLPAYLSYFGPATVRAGSTGCVERLIGTIGASQPLIR
jgi:hypothetical protein